MKLAPHQLRAVAVEAQVDPRTVAAHLAGRPGRALTRQRIDQALEALNLGRAVRARRAAVSKLQVVP